MNQTPPYIPNLSSHSNSSVPRGSNISGTGPNLLLLSPPGNSTRSIVDIISEFNEKNEHTDLSTKMEPLTLDSSGPQELDYHKWVSEANPDQPKLTPSDSCSSGKSVGSGSSTSGNEKLRGSSPDSGCDVSVMVAYTSEPKVRRPEHEGDKPTPAPRKSLKKSKSDSGKLKSVVVPNSENTISTGVCLVRNVQAPCQPDHKSPVIPSYELSCPYSRSAIYSLEGSRLQEHLDNEYSDSGQGSSILSSSSKLRSYASSRDILEMYGTGAGQPLTPRMLGFSSSDLRLPPSALLLSLSGKKSNSTLSVHWPQPSKTSVYQNIPRRIERDTVF